MAIRVTKDDVLDIMDSPDVGNFNINHYIVAASLVIDRVFLNDSNVSADLLKELERWFTAHLIKSNILKSVSEEKLGDATIKYGGKFGMCLDSTTYGQTLKLLDYTGRLDGYLGKPGRRITAIKS